MLLATALVLSASGQDAPAAPMAYDNPHSEVYTGFWEVLGQDVKSPAVKRFCKQHGLKKGRKQPGATTQGSCDYRSTDGLCLQVALDEVVGVGAEVGMGASRSAYLGEVAVGAGSPTLRVGMPVSALIEAWGDPQVGEMDAIWQGPSGYIQVDISDVRPETSSVKGFLFMVEPQYEYRSWFSDHPTQARLHQPVWRSRTAQPSPAPRPAPRPAPAPAAVVEVTEYPSLFEPVRSGSTAKGDAAVVIGLETYPFLGTDVPYAQRDARAFRDLLVYTVGVPERNVQILTAGGREQILEAVERATAAADGGRVWVYFAGHGSGNPGNGERLLLGDDVRSQVSAFASRGVAVREIEQRIIDEGLQAQLVLDACFTGASRSGASIAGGTRFAVPTYATVPRGEAHQWNAAAADQLSGPLDEAEHGAFTYFAIGALRGWADGELTGIPDGQVTGEEAQAYVARKLVQAGLNDQTPVWLGDDVVLTTGALQSQLPLPAP